MIVSSMDEANVIKEIINDLPNVFRYTNFKDRAFRRSVLKSNKFPLFMDVEYLSPLKNKWLILYLANSKVNIGDLCILTYVVTFSTNHGHYAILISFIDSKPIFIFFAPHFFSRYASRMKVNKTGMELMKHYFRRNSGYVYSECKKGICGTTTEGLAFGFQTVGGNFLFKTFVSKQMLKGEQVEDYFERNNLRAEMHEKQIADELNFYKSAL